MTVSFQTNSSGRWPSEKNQTGEHPTSPDRTETGARDPCGEARRRRFSAFGQAASNREVNQRATEGRTKESALDSRGFSETRSLLPACSGPRAEALANPAVNAQMIGQPPSPVKQKEIQRRWWEAAAAVRAPSRPRRPRGRPPPNHRGRRSPGGGLPAGRLSPPAPFAPREKGDAFCEGPTPPRLQPIASRRPVSRPGSTRGEVNLFSPDGGSW
jgi:hypothetical protein